MADQVQGMSSQLHHNPLQPLHKQDNRPNNSNSSKIMLPLKCRLPAAQQPGQQIVHLNLSYFKPEFSGKPEKDAEAHLLHTNDWMNAHHFIEGVKVQKFCLTLLGEARLWYHSLEHISVDYKIYLDSNIPK